MYALIDEGGRVRGWSYPEPAGDLGGLLAVEVAEAEAMAACERLGAGADDPSAIRWDGSSLVLDPTPGQRAEAEAREASEAFGESGPGDLAAVMAAVAELGALVAGLLEGGE